ncbi:MAG: aldehyde dehydrogenase family protein, partial [Acidobacteriota bacterium]|nr:aldehyde dehydrogenase family protein [Acidobacteriota bacterium]
MQTQKTLDEFKNEPFVDYSKAENADLMKAAIERVRGELGRDYPVIINGEKITLDAKFESVNPAEKSQVVGRFSDADADSENLTGKAIDAATEAFKTWRNVPTNERAEYLFKAAKIVRDDKHYYSAWMCFETGKTWAEADGDTAEAIDFLEFYGREMLRWAEPQPITKVSGEDNRFEYVPLGVGAIIPPWNFPLAIMAGMTTAAIVCGNTTVLKPSPDAPTIAYKFMEILEQIGLPKG